MLNFDHQMDLPGLEPDHEEDFSLEEDNGTSEEELSPIIPEEPVPHQEEVVKRDPYCAQCETTGNCWRDTCEVSLNSRRGKS